MKTPKALILEKNKYNFNDLVDIVKILRGEGGCPWDIEQTHKSIRDDLIEETYEVIEAIDTENPDLLREELGDVLLQIVFHAGIESDEGRFTIDDVADEICKKMIYRHPHVFSDTVADTSEEVLKNWENLKSDEQQRKTVTDKLRAIPIATGRPCPREPEFISIPGSLLFGCPMNGLPNCEYSRMTCSMGKKPFAASTA